VLPKEEAICFRISWVDFYKGGNDMNATAATEVLDLGDPTIVVAAEAIQDRNRQIDEASVSSSTSKISKSKSPRSKLSASLSSRIKDIPRKLSTLSSKLKNHKRNNTASIQEQASAKDDPQLDTEYDEFDLSSMHNDNDDKSLWEIEIPSPKEKPVQTKSSPEPALPPLVIIKHEEKDVVFTPDTPMTPTPMLVKRSKETSVAVEINSMDEKTILYVKHALTKGKKHYHMTV
jgi:hypothetical protein